MKRAHNFEYKNTFKCRNISSEKEKKRKNKKSQAFEVPLFCGVSRIREKAHRFWCFLMQNSFLSFKIPIYGYFKRKLSVLKRFEWEHPKIFFIILHKIQKKLSEDKFVWGIHTYRPSRFWSHSIENSKLLRRKISKVYGVVLFMYLRTLACFGQNWSKLVNIKNIFFLQFSYVFWCAEHEYVYNSCTNLFGSWDTAPWRVSKRGVCTLGGITRDFAAEIEF